MEYHRYLKEVVNALESDPEFRKKLEKADEADIRVSCLIGFYSFCISFHLIFLFTTDLLFRMGKLPTN